MIKCMYIRKRPYRRISRKDERHSAYHITWVTTRLYGDPMMFIQGFRVIKAVV